MTAEEVSVVSSLTSALVGDGVGNGEGARVGFADGVIVFTTGDEVEGGDVVTTGLAVAAMGLAVDTTGLFVATVGFEVGENDGVGRELVALKVGFDVMVVSPWLLAAAAAAATSKEVP